MHSAIEHQVVTRDFQVIRVRADLSAARQVDEFQRGFLRRIFSSASTSATEASRNRSFVVPPVMSYFVLGTPLTPVRPNASARANRRHHLYCRDDRYGIDLCAHYLFGCFIVSFSHASPIRAARLAVSKRAPFKAVL